MKLNTSSTDNLNSSWHFIGHFQCRQSIAAFYAIKKHFVMPLVTLPVGLVSPSVLEPQAGCVLIVLRVQSRTQLFTVNVSKSGWLNQEKTTPDTLLPIVPIVRRSLLLMARVDFMPHYASRLMMLLFLIAGIVSDQVQYQMQTHSKNEH